MEYVNVQKIWRKAGPIYRCPEARAIWLPELMLHDQLRQEDHGTSYTLNRNEMLIPADFDTCDWRYNREGCHGPTPAYWDFVRHSACHWLVNLHLFVSGKIEPKTPWRIVTSEKHSTLCDGKDRLWDPQYMALGVSAEDAWERAFGQKDSMMLPAGMRLEHPTQGTSQAVRKLVREIKEVGNRIYTERRTVTV